MFVLDLFNNDHERRLAEGAVDQLEQRRIDDLAMKMDDLVARARTASTAEAKQALMKEFQKCKAERDGYYKVRNETMGYGGLTSEAGIPGNVPVEKIPGKEDLLKGQGRTYYEGQDETVLDKYKERIGTQGNLQRDNDRYQDWRDSRHAVSTNLHRNLERQQDANTDDEIEKMAINRDRIQKDNDDWKDTFDMMRDRINRYQWSSQSSVNPKKLKKISGIKYQPTVEEAGDVKAKTDDALRAYWEKVKREKQAGTTTSVPAEKIPGKSDLLKGQGRSYYEGEEGEWSKEGPWTTAPKSKSGKPVDPRGEVTHLSDVARRKAERDANMRSQIKREIAADRIENKIQNAIAQKKNSKAVAEEKKSWDYDLSDNPWRVTDADAITETDFEVALQGPDNQQLNFIIRPIDFIETQTQRFQIDSMDVRDLQTGKTKHVQSGKDMGSWIYIFDAIDEYFWQSPLLQKHLKKIIDYYMDAGEQGKNPDLMPGLNDRPIQTGVPADRFVKSHQDMKKVTGQQDVDEGKMGEIDAQRQDLERMNERQFYTAYGISKAAFQQKYRTLLNPADLQDTPVEEGYEWKIDPPNME